jgi:hypothetical protein
MRWTIRLLFAFAVGWALFMASPFLALRSLGKAAETRDLGQIEKRVNFRALRISLAKQIAAEYLRATGRAPELSGFRQNAATGAGVAFADPLIGQLVTPAAVLQLLDGRLPEAVTGDSRPVPLGLPKNWRALGGAWRTWLMSESRGFRTLLVPFPVERPRADQFRLQLRLDGTTWRLIGIELPATMVAELVRQLPRPPT